MVRSFFNRFILPLIIWIPFFRFIRETKGTQTPITFLVWFVQNIIGINRGPYWPMHYTSTLVGGWRNVYAGIEVSPGLSPGCYIQALGQLYIGDYTQIASNVGIITSNHELTDSRRHVVRDVRIGSYCWIGMGAIILPGVQVGDYTIVAAGAVVTKSFPNGYCVIAGNPARIVKDLTPDSCVRHRSTFEYNGYYTAEKFKSEVAKKLLVRP